MIPGAKIIEHSGHRYCMVIGSDLERDGMTLELVVDDRSEAPPLEMFYSDVTESFTLSTLEHASIPLEVVEEFIRVARHRLPPARSDTTDEATPII